MEFHNIGAPFDVLLFATESLGLDLHELERNGRESRERLDRVRGSRGHVDLGAIAGSRGDGRHRSNRDPFYYRPHSPAVRIEFEHLPGVACDNPEPSRHHIHTVIRTPNGGDYGADLLTEHHTRFDHHRHA